MNIRPFDEVLCVPHSDLEEFLAKSKENGVTAVVLNADHENAAVAVIEPEAKIEEAPIG